MKSMSDYTEPVRTLWIMHEALRRLGFDAEEIFVGQHKEPIAGRLIDVLNCTLKAQGKQFVINCGHYPKGGIEAAFLEWNELVENLTSGVFTDDDLNMNYHAWPFEASRVDFVIALTNKGFKIPTVTDEKSTSKKATTDMIS